nr:MAG TPA: hypothetical protein [Caudoviricetes sp.]
MYSLTSDILISSSFRSKSAIILAITALDDTILLSIILIVIVIFPYKAVSRFVFALATSFYTYSFIRVTHTCCSISN